MRWRKGKLVVEELLRGWSCCSPTFRLRQPGSRALPSEKSLYRLSDPSQRHHYLSRPPPQRPTFSLAAVPPSPRPPLSGGCCFPLISPHPFHTVPGHVSRSGGTAG